MALYMFRRDDNGECFEKKYRIGECPKEIVCEDGVIARHVITAPAVQWKGGFLPPGAAMKRTADMKRKQDDAGRKMKDSWKSVKDE